MAVKFRAATDTKDTGSGTCNKPAGVVSGDYLIAIVGVYDTSTSVTAPSGWTLQHTANDGNSRALTYTKTAGSSEPTSYTWSGPSYVDMAIIALYSDASKTLQLDGTVSSANGSTFQCPSVTATNANEALVVGWVSDQNSGTGNAISANNSVTIDSSDSSLTGNANDDGFVAGHKILTASGATGTTTFSGSGWSAAGMGTSLLVQEAGGTTHSLGASARSTFLSSTGLVGQSRAKFFTNTVLAESARSTFKTNTALQTQARETFKTAASLRAQARDTFLTAAVHTTQARSTFSTRTALSGQSRATFSLRTALASAARSTFKSAAGLATQARDTFAIRTALAAEARSTFSVRTALTQLAQSTFKIASSGAKFLGATARVVFVGKTSLETETRATFATRTNFAAQARSAFSIRTALASQARSRFLSSIAFAQHLRATFATRAALAAQARATFATRFLAGVQARARFLTKFLSQVPIRARFVTSAALSTPVRSTFKVSGIVVILPFRLAFQSAKQLLSIVPKATVSSLSIALKSVVPALSISVVGSVRMADPNTTIAVTLSATNINGVAVTNCSAVAVVVTFPDGTTSNYSLASGVTNNGDGTYTLQYTTKGIGTNTEVWNFTAADGTTKAEYVNKTPVWV